VEQPLPAGSPISVFATVRNLGNVNISGAILSFAYNLWLGNEPEEMVPIGNGIQLPTLSPGDITVAETTWTPPDEDTTHACVHARVWDLYSQMNYGARATSWYSFENPQAGNHNVTLFVARDPEKALVIVFHAKNTGAKRRKYRASVSRQGQLAWAITEAERPGKLFPLPMKYTLRSPDRGADALSFEKSRPRVAERIGRVGVPGKRPPVQASAHFGWDAQGKCRHPNEGRRLRFSFQVDPAELGQESQSLPRTCEGSLDPGEVRAFRLVIAPEELPPRGGRRRFRIDYQLANGLPVQTFVDVAV
jgi:hypothetical protein